MPTAGTCTTCRASRRPRHDTARSSASPRGRSAERSAPVTPAASTLSSCSPCRSGTPDGSVAAPATCSARRLACRNEAATDTWSCGATASTSKNIASSWRSTLAARCYQGRTCITSTGSRQTIAWRIWNCGLRRNPVGSASQTRLLGLRSYWRSTSLKFSDS